MSNQKIDFYMMTVMTQYVNKEKTYNFLELKGAVEFASLMLENAFKVEDIPYAAQEFSNTMHDKSIESAKDSPNEHFNGLYYFNEYLSESSNEAKDTSIQEDKPLSEETLVTETFTRWPRELVDRIVLWSIDIIRSERSITQNNIAKMFLANFGSEIPEREKKSTGKNRAMYINKLHKNIYNNLIKKNGSVEFDKNTYWYVKVRYESVSN
jgi:hypothetical protein